MAGKRAAGGEGGGVSDCTWQGTSAHCVWLCTETEIGLSRTLYVSQFLVQFLVFVVFRLLQQLAFASVCNVLYLLLR